MDSLKISVIIPVYNAEEWLDRCIQSVLHQSFSEFELILVDDGSTDKSLIICDGYASSDSRIKVIHKANGGVSSARNKALEVARGEFVTFVDSDDYLADDYLANLYHPDYDVIISGYIVDDVSYEPPFAKLEGNTDMANLIEELYDWFYFRTPWAKLFKRELIEKLSIRFDERLKYGEDTVFVLTVLKEVACCLAIRYAGYIHTIGEGEDAKYKLSTQQYRLGLTQIEKCLERFQNSKNSMELAIDKNRQIYYWAYLRGGYRLTFIESLKRSMAYLWHRGWYLLPTNSHKWKLRKALLFIMFPMLYYRMLKNN